MNRLFPFVLISMLFHLSILGIIPKYEITPKSEPVIVEVEIIQSKPKPKPVPRQQVNVSPSSKPAPEGASKPSAFSAEPSVVVPDLDIPNVDLNSNYSVEIPELKVSEIPADAVDRTGKELLSEIRSSAVNAQKGIVSGETGSNSRAKDGAESDFFTLDSISNSKRRITHVPTKPTFSLAGNTKVQLRFKIDRQGNTYGIVLITRSDSKVEKLAAEFVEKIKFNSVAYASADSAEITLLFKVK